MLNLFKSIKSIKNRKIKTFKNKSYSIPKYDKKNLSRIFEKIKALADAARKEGLEF